jgi:hypothetical protein
MFVLGAWTSPAEKQLIADLQARYTKLERPTANISHPVFTTWDRRVDMFSRSGDRETVDCATAIDRPRREEPDTHD